MRLADGSLEFIYNDGDFLRMVEDRLGVEAGEYVQKLIDSADYTKRRLETDLIAYESSFDGYNKAFGEALELLKKAVEIADTPRARRTEIAQYIKDAIVVLENGDF